MRVQIKMQKRTCKTKKGMKSGMEMSCEVLLPLENTGCNEVCVFTFWQV